MLVDEATSALDVDTERQLTEFDGPLQRQFSLSHRLHP